MQCGRSSACQMSAIISVRKDLRDLINCPDCGRTHRDYNEKWLKDGYSCESVCCGPKQFLFCTEDKCQVEITRETARALITANYPSEHLKKWEYYCKSQVVSFYLWRPLITTVNESYCPKCNKIYKGKR